MESIRTDVLVIGGGLAAVCAAIESCKYGLDVSMVDKGRIGSSGSSCTSGGSPQVRVATELGGHPDDGRETYFSDIVKGGEYLSDQEMVAVLVDEAPARTIEIDRLGVPFRKGPDGKFLIFKTLGMSYPRVGRVKHFGVGMMQALRKEALHRGVRPVEGVMITRLVVEHGTIAGAVGFHVSSGVPYLFQAKCIILTAGSALALYPNSSANYLTTGDGYALAWELNVPFRNMEFIEFTVIPAPYGMPFPSGGIKGVTGKGAKFYNRFGERFLTRYDPVKLELTTRARLVQAIYKELKAGNGPCDMDLSDCPAAAELTMVEQKLEKAFGFKCRKEKIPWVPAGHSFLGGATIDAQCCTGIPGLYAAGETAGHAGIFGADRVGGAIAACLVLGNRAGKFAAEEALQKVSPNIPAAEVDREEKRWQTLANPSGLAPDELRQKLQQICLDHLGVVRTGRDLASALNKIEEIEHHPVSVKGVKERVAALEVKNLALTAKLVAAAGAERKESRGQHQREDYPEQKDQQWIKWIQLTKKGDTISIQKKDIPLDRYPIRP